LQFIAPFIHAHAFGSDTYKEQAFHVHNAVVASPNTAATSLSQTLIGESQFDGAIVTVASGIKNSVADDIATSIAVMAIFFTLALLIFNAFIVFTKHRTQTLPHQRYSYSSQSPRAPPR
jgi:hypothetical protein